MLSSQQSEYMGLFLNGLSWSASCLGLVECAASSRVFPVVCSPTVESVHGQRVELESVFFGCALSFLNVQRSGGNWCVFWRPAALSTVRPQSAPTPWRLIASGWQRGGKRLQGRAGHCTLVYREMQRKHREMWGGGTVGEGWQLVWPASAQGERRANCAADCLTETQAVGWWHFTVTTCNPTNFSWWKSSFSNIEPHRVVVVVTAIHFCICFNFSQKLELGLVPYGGITYFMSSTVNCESFIWQKPESVPYA